MTTALVLAGYMLAGLFASIAYHVLWQGPWRWRHMYGWPILNTSMIVGWPPPPWMYPAPADLAAADRQRAWARNETASWSTALP